MASTSLYCVVGDDRYGQFVTLAQGAGPIGQPTALGLPAASMNAQDVITAGVLWYAL
ncbi:hypothetical protein [Pseudomonas sp. FSL W5-0203]|uniref:hypothetical protein n=1 Tax=Pseudomonas sp. FSL W5-0203 TaxID=1920491 RepID=UPI000AAA1602|nr:hypothetical protein [Pseudomonas sp. FSL W5-0203]